MEYLAKFEPDGDGYLVTFPDVPEAITGGETEAEARSNAAEALELALLAGIGEASSLPAARLRSDLGDGDYRTIPVSAAATAKVAFVLAFRESGMTRVALAARLGKTEGEVRRMLKPTHATKLPALEAGLAALGKRLVVTVKEAA